MTTEPRPDLDAIEARLRAVKRNRLRDGEVQAVADLDVLVAYVQTLEALEPSDAAIQTAERAYWKDYGVSVHNMGAALRAAYAVDCVGAAGALTDKELQRWATYTQLGSVGDGNDWSKAKADTPYGHCEAPHPEAGPHFVCDFRGYKPDFERHVLEMHGTDFKMLQAKVNAHNWYEQYQAWRERAEEAEAREAAVASPATMIEALTVAQMRHAIDVERDMSFSAPEVQLSEFKRRLRAALARSDKPMSDSSDSKLLDIVLALALGDGDGGGVIIWKLDETHFWLKVRDGSRDADSQWPMVGTGDSPRTALLDAIERNRDVVGRAPRATEDT